MVVQDYSIKHVFVDRKNELSKLNELLAKVKNGFGQIINIKGEHGIGKTRLVEEFKRILESQQDETDEKHPIQFFSSRCKRTAGRDPYQPFIEAFNLNINISKTSIHETDNSEPENGKESSNNENINNKFEPAVTNNNPFSETQDFSESSIQAKPLGLIPLSESSDDTLIPENEIEPKEPERPKSIIDQPLPMGLIPAAFRATEVNDFKTHRSYLFEDITKHIIDLTQKAPVILFLDDFHWVNLASLGYLQYLVDKISDKPVLLIFILCSDEMSEINEKTKKIDELCQNLENFDNYTELTLERFDISNVSQMIKMIFSREDVPEEFIEQIYNKTEGNPLFIEDTIRALIEEDIIDVSRFVWQTRIDVSQIKIPDSTRDALITRFRKLNKDILKTLSYAAVIGREFTFDLLENLTEIPTEQLLDHIDLLLENKLIHEDLSSKEDLYRFDNPLILDIAYTQLSRSRRRYLHTKIGTILEQQNINDVSKVVYDIGNHFSKGWEYDKALKYLVLAGDNALQMYAIDDARRYYLSALEILNKFDYSIKIQQHEIELLSNLGYTCQMLGDWDQALEYYQSLPQLIENLQNKLNTQNKEKVEGTDKPEAEVIPTNWIQLKLADTYWNMAELMRYKSAWKRAERFYKRSLGISQEIDDYHGVAQAERGRGYINWRQGQYRNALDHYDICIDFATKINDLPVIAVTYIDIGNIYNYLGQWEEAVAYYTESIEHLGKIGWLHETGRAYNGLGEVYAKQEQWEKALENFIKSEEISKKIGDSYKRGVALFNMAECYAKMNQLNKAMENCQLSEEILTRLDDRVGLAMVYRNFGIIYHFKKDWDKADNYFKKSLNLLKNLKVPYESGFTYMEYGLMLKSKGDDVHAYQSLSYSLEIFKNMDAKGEIEHLEKILKSMKYDKKDLPTPDLELEDVDIKDQKVES